MPTGRLRLLPWLCRSQVAEDSGGIGRPMLAAHPGKGRSHLGHTDTSKEPPFAPWLSCEAALAAFLIWSLNGCRLGATTRAPTPCGPFCWRQRKLPDQHLAPRCRTRSLRPPAAIARDLSSPDSAALQDRMLRGVSSGQKPGIFLLPCGIERHARQRVADRKPFTWQGLHNSAYGRSQAGRTP